MKTSEVAYFGAGCFWCSEAVFDRIPGVISVVPGYAGGDKADPTYEEVSSGITGHAEVAKIEFDPTKVTYAKLLEVFFAMHDPTSLNRQGADVGTQYRSIILTTNQKQVEEANKANTKIAGSVTEIKPLDTFYEAEYYHNKYFENHTNAPYCQLVIAPKLKKLGLASEI